MIRAQTCLKFLFLEFLSTYRYKYTSGGLCFLLTFDTDVWKVILELLSDPKYSDSHFTLIEARTSIPENCSVVINNKKTPFGLFTWFSVIWSVN